MTDPRRARKAAVRARMAETGENYTQANAAIAAQRDSSTSTARVIADMDARRHRYEAAAQTARDHNIPVYTALWRAFDVVQPSDSRIEAALAIPTGDVVAWTSFTEGGRELAEKIDRTAHDEGLRLADARLLRRRHQPRRYADGPLVTSVWNLRAVLADIEAGVRAGQEDRCEAQELLDENYSASMRQAMDTWISFAWVGERIAILEPPNIDLTGVDPELEDL
ncbi:hypothetical protein [Streptomyces sp. MJM8645]|uniref:hypothetical protein n=1 Tax=Streptomycetaceae TaxID=2062 RepID=UPI0007AF9739|nr:hypothetical protein [Streptomyces sp. MJM8645]